jgi:hypothetical protein
LMPSPRSARIASGLSRTPARPWVPPIMGGTWGTFGKWGPYSLDPYNCYRWRGRPIVTTTRMCYRKMEYYHDTDISTLLHPPGPRGRMPGFNSG